MLGGIGEGDTHVQGFGRSEDTMATVHAMRALGVEVEELGDDELLVHGVGLRGLRAPDGPVDCANAGTLIRLLAGVLAGQQGRFVLTGDESLRTRPMERIAEPLRRMGGDVTTDDGHAPLTIEGSAALQGIEFELRVASAQVKSAVLLAGPEREQRDDGTRAKADARPHGADAGGRWRSRAPKARLRHARPRRLASARRARRTGRLLVRSAVVRGGGARPGQ